MRPEDWQPIFQPRSIAVIGASSDPNKFGGRTYLMLRDRKDHERLYAVNPNISDIDGQKAYARLQDIEDDIDFAAIAVPADFVVEAVRDCVEKKVRAVEILAAGFSETGTPDGIERERQIIEIVRNSDLRLVGPNCFGIYSPESALTILPGPTYPKAVGHIGLMAQSGGFTSQVVSKVLDLGYRFTRAVSYGNASDLNETDFMAYFRDDDRTKIVVAYLEGVKEGRKFAGLLRETCLRKPVIIWKGGLSQMGSRAVASHTASLAGSKAIWDGFFGQTGAVSAVGIDDVLDMIVGFSCLPDFSRSRMSVVGGGGAITVAAADALDREGLSMLPFSDETQQAIRAILPPHGNSVKNPVDIGGPRFIPRMFKPILEAVAASDRVDAVIIEHIIVALFAQEYVQELVDVIAGISAASGKPMIITMPQTSMSEKTIESEGARRRFRGAYLGISAPVFDTMQKAASVLARIKRYNEFKAGRTAGQASCRSSCR